MALQFNGYGRDPGEEIRNRWGNSIDSIFQAYQQAKQNARSDRALSIQEQAAAQQSKITAQQLAAGQRASLMNQIGDQSQFGMPLTPENVRAAISQPGDPKYAQFAQGLHEIGQARTQPLRKGEAELDQMSAKSELERAQADALRDGQVYVDPATGRQIIVPHGSKLIPRVPMGKGQAQPDLDAALELYETAKEGLMSGLGGSDTGRFVGMLPAITANQQIAKGSVAAMAPVLKQLFRTAGEGVFTDRDQQLLLEMVPGRTDLPEARNAMIANIDKIVKAKLRSANRSAAPSTKSDPLGILK